MLSLQIVVWDNLFISIVQSIEYKNNIIFKMFLLTFTHFEKLCVM